MLDGRTIGISVKQIDEPEAERLAAVFAWFATTAHACSDVNEWPETLQHIFSDYIALTMDEQVAEELSANAFSTEVCAAALREFIRINNLSSSIERHLYPQPSPDAESDRVVH